MSSVSELITAMHTAGAETPRTCTEWIELAQQHSALLGAFHGVFGKRLPVPNKLGLWLSKHNGEATGELTLQGRHSGRRKAWVYRVLPTAKLVTLLAAEQTPFPPPPKPAPTMLPPEPPPKPKRTPEPPPAPEYLTRDVPDRDGTLRTEYVRDRGGNPIPLNRPAVAPAPAAPAPPEKPAKTPVTFRGQLRAGTHDNPGALPAWAKRLPNGTVVARQPTRKELAAAHEGRSAAIRISDRGPDGTEINVRYVPRGAVAGFANPGGIPQHNYTHSARVERGTEWDGSLENL